MVQTLKQMLLDEPQNISSLLELYDFCHIHIKKSEIRFARDEDGGQNISIKLNKNPFIYVTDFVLSKTYDIIGFIMSYRNDTFINVLNNIKSVLGLDAQWKPVQKRAIFGGIYEEMKGNKIEEEIQTYDQHILDRYYKCANQRFLNDGISISSQAKFDIRYDMTNDNIIIPIYTPYGDLMGIKARINFESINQPKYFYPVGCQMSRTLYGFSHNYQYLCDSNILVFESEKSVMLADTYGYKNCVALGCNNLSENQAKLLKSVNPKSIVFMLDCGLDIAQTRKNINLITEILSNKVSIKYWNWKYSLCASGKDSPIDNGLESFEFILAEELVEVKRGDVIE